MPSQALRSTLMSPLVFSAILINAVWLSEMAMAHPSTPTSTDTTPSVVLRRATTSAHRTTTSARATVTVTPTVAADDSKSKGLSLAVIIVIVVAVVVVLIAVVGFAFWCYRNGSKQRKNKGLDLPSIGQRSSRPLSAAAARRAEPDWWQPPNNAALTVDSHDHTIVPYDLGGHGYTYGGRTLDVPSPTAETGSRVSVGYAPQTTEQDLGRPFQNPVLASPLPPPRPQPSISPSYHTYAGQDERSVWNPRELDTIRSGSVYNPQPYAPPTTAQAPPPSGGFQPRDTNLSYLEPQLTGTSIYSSPYEVTAMTRSTSGHPGT